MQIYIKKFAKIFVIVIWEKINFKAKSITRNKEGLSQ